MVNSAWCRPGSCRPRWEALWPRALSARKLTGIQPKGEKGGEFGFDHRPAGKERRRSRRKRRIGTISATSPGAGTAGRSLGNRDSSISLRKSGFEAVFSLWPSSSGFPMAGKRCRGLLPGGVTSFQSLVRRQSDAGSTVVWQLGDDHASISFQTICMKSETWPSGSRPGWRPGRVRVRMQQCVEHPT